MACLLCSNTLRIVAKLTLPLLLAACASSPAPAPNANANAAATTSASPSKPAPAAKADAPDPALRKLWLTARYVELIDCGHNGAVWSVACKNDEDVMVTGGADGNTALCSLALAEHEQRVHLEGQEQVLAPDVPSAD